MAKRAAVTFTEGSQDLFAMPPVATSNGAAKRPRRETAESMATKQKEIAVSEFFAKNRHLLGFDNPRKALLTTVKEAVDNSLDACEEAEILPEIWVKIEALNGKPKAKDDDAKKEEHPALFAGGRGSKKKEETQ